MDYLRLMKYPGAKTVLIPDIIAQFRKSGQKKFVDVFGGSGLVLLNIRANIRIYNDLDPNVVNIFKTIQKHPKFMKDNLKDAVMDGYFSRKNLRKSADQIIPEIVEVESQVPPGSSERAFLSLCRYMSSFGGMGDTYNTIEKSVHTFASKTLDQFPKIEKIVSEWAIENMDYKSLIEKYDSKTAFFYLDPPYFNKKWYNFNFRESDYEELNSLLKTIKGKYLMTLDASHDDLEDIFGEPDYVKRYDNQNGNSSGGRPRLKAFYTNV